MVEIAKLRNLIDTFLNYPYVFGYAVISNTPEQVLSTMKQPIDPNELYMLYTLSKEAGYELDKHEPSYIITTINKRSIFMTKINEAYILLIDVDPKESQELPNVISKLIPKLNELLPGV